MAKRIADKQLTLENFEDEEEREDNYHSSGPQVASEEVLRKRLMAKPKKRSDLNSTNSDSNEKKSAFSGFKGFSSNPMSNTISSVNPFQTSTQSKPITNSVSTPLSLISPLFASNQSENKLNANTVEKSLVSDNEQNYYKKLSELNQCFMSHVKSYMTKSSYYDFTQVCKEYIEYHQKIESEINHNNEENGNSLNAEKKVTEFEVKSISSTPKDSQNSSQFGTQSQSTIGSSGTNSSSISSEASANQFSQTLTDESMFAKPSIQFSFVGNKLSQTLDNSSVDKQKVNTNEANDDDNEEPPKAESVSHHESDAVFSKRCKLYFKKGNQFVEKGLGHLFIKKGENASNAQLLIRADTTLGNVLLNISLVDSLPVLRAENNKGVLLTCVPNPPLDPKLGSGIQTSVTFLIRVKTTQDSDQLYDSLIQYKSA